MYFHIEDKTRKMTAASGFYLSHPLVRKQHIHMALFEQAFLNIIFYKIA
jgi:hypothetical protein